MPTQSLTVMELANAIDRNRMTLTPAQNAAPALPPASLPGRISDRSKQFVTALQAQVNGALCKCEEKFPGTGHHSVLYVVLENNAAQLQNQVNRLHEEFFGPEQQDPLAPVRLEVVDRATDAALRRLLEIGLVRPADRTSRTLWPREAQDTNPRPLTGTEIRKAAFLGQRAAQKLKVVKVLATAGLEEDARAPLLEAMLAAARKLATEQRLPEPEVLHESLLPPFSACWGLDLGLFRRFATDASEPCPPVAEALSRLL